MKNLLLSVCMLVAGAAFAGNVTWTGAVNSNWSEPGNWKDATDASGLPTAADVAVFNVGEATTINVDTQSAACQQIKIEANSAELTFGGTGKISISSPSGSVGSASSYVGTSMVVNNLNATTCPTAFMCAIDVLVSGKKLFGPGSVFYGDVCIVNANWVGFVGNSNVTASDELKKTVIHGNFCAASGITLSVYCISADNELVIDIDDPQKEFNTSKLNFVVNGTAKTYAHCGKVTFKRGRARIPSGHGNATTSTVTDRFVVDGGTVLAGEAAQDLTNGFHFVSGTYSTTKVVSPTWDYPSRLILSGFEDGYFGSGKTLVLNASYANCAYFYDEPNPKIVIDGKVIATNSNSSLRFCNGVGNGVVSGSGEIVARVLNISKKYATCTFKDLTLTLGDGFQPNNASTTAVFDGATLQAYGNWGHLGSNAGTYKLVGAVDFDTADAFGGVTPHSIWLKTVTAEDGLGLTVRGGGTVAHVFAANTALSWDKLTVADNTTYVLSNATALAVSELSLGKGAKLAMNTGYISADKITLGDGCEITVPFRAAGSLVANGSGVQQGAFTLNVTVPPGTAQVAYPIVRGFALDPSKTTFNLVDPDGNLSNVHYEYDGLYIAPTVTPDPTVSEWTGAVDGSWEKSGNWTIAPTADAAAYFSGFNHLAVNHDVDTTPASITFRDTAGPFVISGKELAFPKANAAQITSSSYADQRIACDFSLAAIAANSGIFATSGRGRIIFDGKVDVKKFTDYTTHFNLSGEVAFAGQVTLRGFKMASGAICRVLEGGDVSVVEQSNNSGQSLNNGSIKVDEGGSFAWASTCDRPFLWTVNSSHTVNGTMNIARTIQAKGNMTFTGTGTLNLCATNDTVCNSLEGTANTTVNLKGGIRTNVNNPIFRTTYNGREKYSARISAEDGTTLGAYRDWTYGLGAITNSEIITSTPADRALAIAGTVTVDTSDPATDDPHTITFTDPIVGDGTLVKTGAGTLALVSDANDIRTGLTLEGGAVSLAHPIATGSLKFDGGGVTVPKSERGSYADWATVVTAASIEGDPVETSGKYELRVVDGEGDTKLLQAKYKAKGLLLILR